MELYEAMNEKIADIIAIDGTPSSLYASAYIKDLRTENARLNAENLRLSTELAHREEDLIHADEKVFYRETAVKLDEDKIKKQAIKEFAEKFKKEFLKHFPTLFTDAIYQCTDSELDNLITELYGADE